MREINNEINSASLIDAFDEGLGLGRAFEDRHEGDEDSSYNLDED